MNRRTRAVARPTGPAAATAPVPPAGSTQLLVVDDLRVSFDTPRGLVHAVNGVSLRAERGKTLGIVGESGSGKSVTARAIMGLLPESHATVDGGSIRLDGEELLGLSERALRARRGRDMAMVFQDPMRSLNPTMRVGAQIAEAVRIHEPVSREAARARTLALLEGVRIPDAAHFANAYPHQLSGGMQQRVMIAMALSCNPALLIADEATTALDVTTQAQILDLLRELQESHGMAIIMITHDLGVAAWYTDSIAIMYAGRIVEHAPTDRLFAEMRMPYTRGLLDSVPAQDAIPGRPLPSIVGSAPDLVVLPEGCSFRPRCTRADDRCGVETPVLVETRPGTEHTFACWNPIDVDTEARAR